MIKVISFDIGNTLLCDKSNNENYNIKALATLINLPYDKVRLVYKDVFQRKKGSLDELLDLFCIQLDIPVTDELKDFFVKKFDINDNSLISTENIELLKKLKNMGYKVILFSNSCTLIKNKLDKKQLDMVDEIFYSYDIGYTKSDSESYKYIEKKMGYKPDEFLHIGDNFNSDYKNPILNGWNALYYGRVDNDKIECINNLGEVLNYLSSYKSIKHYKKNS